MAKTKQAQQPDVQKNGPIDLFAEGILEEPKRREEGNQLYTVEAAGKKVELTIDQLIELARLCIEMKLPQQAESGAEDNSLADVPELLEFVKNYPGIMEFPPEVEQEILRGKKPLDAYRSYENDQLRKKLRALEQNETNRKSSIGSAKGEVGSDNELDELMAVYNSIFR